MERIYATFPGRVSRHEERLQKRIREDDNIDALDALKNARALVAALTSVREVVFDASTHYVLSARMREDFSRNDLTGALDDAHRLLEAARRRWRRVTASTSKGDEHAR